MAKIDLNPMFKGVHGKLDDIVFRKFRGKTIMGPMPEVGGERSDAQIAHQERFTKAAEWGSLVLADPETAPLYEAVAKERDINPIAVCIADYFYAPTVEQLDALNYNGQVGSTIAIQTHDDFGVVKVEMVLSDDDSGALIEKGWAVENIPGKGMWTYTATVHATAGITVAMRATAFDRPGGSGSQSGTKRI